MTSREVKLIDNNYDVLTEIPDLFELIIKLYSRHAITLGHKNAINSKITDLERNDALFEILKRRSLKDYRVMISVLREVNCCRAANILEGIGK